MSDVPLGLFLSGGLDSSGLAALMAPMVSEPIRTFAVGFAEQEANELRYARLVARAVGARFGVACVGSRLLTGVLSPDDARALTDASATTLEQAVTAAGVDPAQLGRDETALSRIGAYVEA